MDMKKIGAFLKSLRKEKGLTQEQLAEVLGVAGRTVSRWETASNMPDLSILIQIAELYDVEVKEILNGERKKENTDKEIKETLKMVADYNKIEKEERIKIGYRAFYASFLVCAVIFLVQLVWFMDLKFIIGEIVVLLTGGISAVFMTVRSGLWSVSTENKSAVKRDMMVSSVISLIFAVACCLLVYRFIGSIPRSVVFALVFFLMCTALGFIVLRLLNKLNRKHKK